MKKMAAATLLALSTIAAHASTIQVLFSDTTGSAAGVTGSFAGVDANQDGLLEFSELSAWTVNLAPGDLDPTDDLHPTLENLNAFGDFNYKTSVWIANGLSVDRVTHNAYMTFDNFKYSFNTAFPADYHWEFVTTVRDTSNNVPEPATLSLMGISLAALGFMRRKKQK